MTDRKPGLNVGRKTIRNTQLVSYGVALLSVALALGITLSLGALMDATPTPLFFVAVMVSAWYGGLGPGLLATALSTLAVNYFLIEPRYSLNITNLGTVVQPVVFSIAALLISGLNESRRVAIRREQRARTVSEATQSEAQVAKEQLETVLSSLTDAFYVLDRHWCYTYVNDRLCEIIGKEREQILGYSIWDLFPDVVDTDVYVQFHRALNDQTSIQAEYFYAGWNRWYNHRIYPSSDGLTVFATDITEAKRDERDRKQVEESLLESENRLQTALAGARQGIWDWDLTRQILTWDERCKEIFGLPPDFAVTYKWHMDALHADDRQRIQDALAIALRDRTEFSEEYRTCHPNNTVRWILACGRGFYDAVGKPYRMSGTVMDITDRKQAEETLQQRETELRLVTNTAPALISFIDLDQRYRFNNQTYETWFGHPAAENYGKHMREVLGEAAYEGIRSYVEQVLAGQQVTFESQVPYKEGGTRYVSATYVPRLNAQGAVEGFVALVNDISEAKRDEVVRKEAEEALRQSEERFQAFMDHSPTAAWITDRDGRIVYLSQTYFRTFQFPTEDVIGKTVFDVYPADVAKQFLENIRQAADTREVVETNEIAPRFDGTMGDFLVYKFLLGSESEETLVGGVAIDITERKQVETALQQSEERYRYLAELIPQLVWTANAEGVLQDVNQRWSDFTGVTLAQAQITGWEAIVHPDDVPILNNQWTAAQHNGTRYQAEGRMRRADGVYRWHLHQAVPMKNEQGQIIKWFGTATDIEEQKKLEQQRDRILQQEQAARSEAEQANRIKDEFLAVLSHELRSPLNPILGWSKLLRSRRLDEQKTDRALEIIERNAQMQAQLINDLLDVSCILQGKLSLNAVLVDLVSIIQAAIETVRLAAVAKSIQIETLFEPEVGHIWGDPGRLQQVVWNLLSNAIKFTPTGGQVHIQLNQIDSQAQITIQDTGKGIEPSFLPYVFDRFRQEDAATTRRFGGLGLGLAIARYLVELHGGTVWVESPGENQGATFSVNLPLMQRQPTVNADTKLSPLPLGLNGTKILVVDDDDSTREFIDFLLDMYGAKVTAVASAHEAIAIFQQFKPDLLLSDIGMPEIDGYMLMQQVRALPPHQGGQIPAIALTAFAGEADSQRAIAAGFQSHIPKPVDPDALIRAIVQLVKPLNS